MKRIFIFVAALAISLSACKSDKTNSDDKSPEKEGSKVEALKELTDLGISLTDWEMTENTNGKQNILMATLKFEKADTVTIELIAYDAEEKELGRASVPVLAADGEEKQFEFRFHSQMDLEDGFLITMQPYTVD